MDKLINKLSKMKRISLISLSIFLLLFIGFTDWITGFELSIVIFYLVPIALCAWFLNKQAGIFIALTSTIFWLFADLISSSSYSHPLIPFWNTLVLLVIFIVFALLLSTLKSAVEKENIMALSVQKSLLPKTIPEISGFRIFSVWQPTRVVSGDCYDFVNFKDKGLGISLADVCGHGFSAALLMSKLQSSFRIIANENLSSQGVCSSLNRIMVNDLLPDKFTSFFYGILNVENSKFTYTNAGHPPPIIIHSNREIFHLSTGGLLLGVDSNASYQQETVKLEKGDIILLYSDGIVETRNSLGEEFGESRLMDVCLKYIHLSANDFSKSVLDAVNKFSNDNIDDDITLIVIVVT